MERFIIQKSENPNHWVCTDQENLIVCVFENHKFNDTQKFKLLEGDFWNANLYNLFTHRSEMEKWLIENHYEKVF